jgi:hypothetical protein
MHVSDPVSGSLFGNSFRNRPRFGNSFRNRPRSGNCFGKQFRRRYCFGNDIRKHFRNRSCFGNDFRKHVRNIFCFGNDSRKHVRTRFCSCHNRKLKYSWKFGPIFGRVPANPTESLTKIGSNRGKARHAKRMRQTPGIHVRNGQQDKARAG